MNNKTEQRIIAQILAGKSDEFAYFLDTYGQQVFALIARMTDSDEDAEELTQDTFMKAYEHLHQFNGGSSFSTWLYRIAYNTTLSALRKRQVETTVVTACGRTWKTRRWTAHWTTAARNASRPCNAHSGSCRPTSVPSSASSTKKSGTSAK